MSFYCAITKKTVFNERCNKVVMETREKIYRDSEGGELARGNEVVREINVSSAGLAILEEKKAKQSGV